MDSCMGCWYVRLQTPGFDSLSSEPHLRCPLSSLLANPALFSSSSLPPLPDARMHSQPTLCAVCDSSGVVLCCAVLCALCHVVPETRKALDSRQWKACRLPARRASLHDTSHTHTRGSSGRSRMRRRKRRRCPARRVDAG